MEGEIMTKAQENLKADIEKIDDEATLEKIKIFVMGILAQQSIDRPLHKQHSTETENVCKYKES